MQKYMYFDNGRLKGFHTFQLFLPVLPDMLKKNGSPLITINVCQENIDSRTFHHSPPLLISYGFRVSLFNNNLQ